MTAFEQVGASARNVGRSERTPLEVRRLPLGPYLVIDFNGGGVEFTDIPQFIASLGQPCDPFLP